MPLSDSLSGRAMAPDRNQVPAYNSQHPCSAASTCGGRWCIGAICFCAFTYGNSSAARRRQLPDWHKVHLMIQPHWPARHHQQAMGGDNSGGNDGGSAGGGEGGGNGDDSSQSLDTAIWETSEYNANYGLASLNASNARGYTGQGVTVSVLDLPFDTDHADLVDNLVTGYDALDGDSAVHCPQNGCISAHGTHVAGIILTPAGMHGVAPDVSIKAILISALPAMTSL